MWTRSGCQAPWPGEGQGRGQEGRCHVVGSERVRMFCSSWRKKASRWTVGSGADQSPMGMKGLWAQSWSAGLRMVSGGLVDIMQAECLVWWVVPNSYC